MLNRIGIFIACLVITILREPRYLTKANFWAEEGVLFFPYARSLSLLENIFLPYNGYLHVLPRIIFELVSLAPIKWAATTSAVFAFLQLIPLLYFLSNRSNSILPTLKHKIFACLCYVLIPVQIEVHLSVVNLQWWGAFILSTALWVEKPKTILSKICDLLVIALFSLSGVQAIPTLGVLIIAAALKKYDIKDWRAAVLAIGAMTQLAVLLNSDRALSFPILVDPFVAIALFIQKSIYAPLFGSLAPSSLWSVWSGNFPFILQTTIIGFILFVIITYEALKKLHPFFTFSIWVGIGMFFLFIKTIHIPLDAFLTNSTIGQRYIFPLALPMMMTLSQLVLLREKTITQGVIYSVFLVFCLFGIPNDFFSNRNYESSNQRSWKRQIELKYSPLKSGQEATIHILPDWSVKIKKE